MARPRSGFISRRSSGFGRGFERLTAVELIFVFQVVSRSVVDLETARQVATNQPRPARGQPASWNSRLLTRASGPAELDAARNTPSTATAAGVIPGIRAA